MKMCRLQRNNFNNLNGFNMKTKFSILRQIKAFFIRIVMCRLFGHRINRYLIEDTKQKQCVRCGEIITVWGIMTVDDFEAGRE